MMLGLANASRRNLQQTRTEQNVPKQQTINIDDIHTDGDIQPREAINEDVVAEYAARMEDGDTFPPVVVYADGSDNWLADGYHRVMAATRNGWITIDAEVRKGTRRDAILAAVASNAQHGLRRTNADKRRSVMVLLLDYEWGKWSDNRISEQCGVSQPFVSKLRASYNGYKMNKREVTRNGETYTQDTANIGRKPAPIDDDGYEEVEGQSDTTTEIIDTTTGEVLENAAVVTTKTESVTGSNRLSPFKPATNKVIYIPINTVDLDDTAGVFMSELDHDILKQLIEKVTQLLEQEASNG